MSSLQNSREPDDSDDASVPMDAAVAHPALHTTTTAATPKAVSSRARVPLRKGKWTPEEEVYANRIISYFNRGMLNIPAGTTLRSYLSEKLNCDPMRITKKFAGASCIGKQVFSPAATASDELKACEDELHHLERVFIDRLEQKNAVVFDLRDQSASESGPNSDGEWVRPVGHPAPRSSSRSKHDRVPSNGQSYAFKKAISAPDLTELAQLHEQRSRTLSFGDDDQYTVDDQAAGDLLLGFFRKLHEDHAANSRLPRLKEEEPGMNQDSPKVAHPQSRKQRRVGFGDVSRDASNSLDQIADVKPAFTLPVESEDIGGDDETQNQATSDASRPRVYYPVAGAHALKRRRSSEPALDKMGGQDTDHHSWLLKLRSPHYLGEIALDVPPLPHFSTSLQLDDQIVHSSVRR